MTVFPQDDTGLLSIYLALVEDHHHQSSSPTQQSPKQPIECQSGKSSGRRKEVKYEYFLALLSLGLKTSQLQHEYVAQL
jgi:hypothetical protein